jgi:DNA-binding transcriptional LysR family regulator
MDKLKDLDWNDIEVFLAVAEGGSLSAAGRQLHRSQPTIGRRIQSLEDKLSLTLFTRTPYGYQLTNNGRAIVLSARKVVARMYEFKGQASLLHEHPLGMVSIACGESFAQLLMSNLDKLTAVYPDISIQIQAGINFVNIEKGDADIAIRSQRPTSPNLYVKFLGNCCYAVYASQAYVSQAPEALKANRGETCRWVALQDSKATLPVTQWLEKNVENQLVKLYCSTLTSVLQGVSHGQGLAAIPVFVGEHTEGLVKLTPALNDLSQATWLVSNRNARRVQTIQVVSTWITEIFEQMDKQCFV